MDPKDVRIVDIGCGMGHVTRALTKMGANVIGIDPSSNQLKRARGEETVGNEIYIAGTAQKLPLKNQSMDVVLFINSFHHVPRQCFGDAISESHRVLRPSGTLFIAEPIAEGPQFEVSRLINDETEIRAAAYETIIHVPKKGFTENKEFIYLTENRHTNFDSYKENSTSINPDRLKTFKKYETIIRKNFATYSQRKNGFFTFKNPIRGNVFTRL